MLNLKEFQRLRGFMIAKRNAPVCNNVSKRNAKSKRNATGQVLKGSRVVYQVGLEKQFLLRK